MRKFLKKKIWSHGTPLGYLGSLSLVQIVECFQNSIGLVLQGLEVTPMPFSAMADFGALKGTWGVMYQSKVSLPVSVKRCNNYLKLQSHRSQLLSIEHNIACGAEEVLSYVSMHLISLTISPCFSTSTSLQCGRLCCEHVVAISAKIQRCFLNIIGEIHITQP